MTSTPLRLNAFVNGEATLASQPVVVTTRGLTFDILLDRLTARLKPTFGAVRRLYTLEGARVATLGDLTDDGRYVVAGAEPFKLVKYSDQPASVKKEKTIVPPPTNEIKLPKIVSEGKATKIAAKPKIIFILRNGDLAGQPSRILLPLNTTLEHALFLITDRVKLDSGAVRKLYTMQGVEVASADDIQDQERYIAVGREQLRPIDPAIAASRLPPISKQATHIQASPRQPTQVINGQSGRGAAVHTTKYDAVEKEFKGLLSDPAKKQALDALWTRLDFNGNNIVSLAEIDKLIVEKYPLLNNKPALMRAYKQTTLREGDGDAWVERAEFSALLRNLLYFNKLFAVFDDIDTDDDRRLTLSEFKSGCSKLGLKLSDKEATAAFDGMDSNDGGKVLFDEFCVWVAQVACPVDGETKRTYTTTTDGVGVHGARNGGPASNHVSPSKGAPAKGPGAGAGAGAAGAGGKAGVHTTKYEAVEKEFKGLLSDPAKKDALEALWNRLDFNDNNIVSLAEIDKLVVEKYPALNSKPALMRAYKQTTLREGDGDSWVERAEFPSLLRNLLYFNKLFSVFDDIDADDDRRLTLDEFKAGCSKLGLRLSDKEATAAFDGMDSNDGGKVLFDEFCVWVAKSALPVDGETKKTYTTTTDGPASPPSHAPAQNGKAAHASPLKGLAAAALSAATHAAAEVTQAASPTKAGVQTAKYAVLEKEFKVLMGTPAGKPALDALWTHLDFNGNNIVSLAEIDKLVVEKYPLLNNKPALMRAYKQTTLREGDGDAWVERAEFSSLLRNLLYFNKLFAVFDDIDTDDDRRLTLSEFKSGCSKLGLKLSDKEATATFDGMDSNDGGKVLFDEFCVWVAKTSLPVDGETKKTFTTNEDR